MAPDCRIGVDLGGTKIEVIALDPSGNVLARQRTDSPRGSYENTLTSITEAVRWAENEAGTLGTVGVGTPGSVSPFTGKLRNANSTWLNGKPLRQDLECRLDRPVRIANDANCFALSEAVDGAGKGANVVFGVIIGTGTGEIGRAHV